MISTKFRRAAAAGIAVFLVGVTGLTGTASAAGQDDAVDTMITHAFDGTLSPSERAILIQDYPEIAAVVPDVTGLENVSYVAPAPAPAGALVAFAAQKNQCFVYSGSNTLKSILEFTLYKFTHKATVCSDGKKITSHSKPTYTIDNADSTVDNWTVVDNSVSGVNTVKSSSRLQVRVQQCVVKYGCYANHYPTGTIVAKSNNTAEIKTTQR